jgi:hypothetical protein
LLSAAVRADDGYTEDVGGNPMLVSHRTLVRMVSEIVHMNPTTGAVTAHFVFHNDGPATIVAMGFPVTSTGADFAGVAPPTKRRLDFHSLVDGKPSVVTPIFDKTQWNGKEWINEMDDILWVKKVKFAKWQTRTVDDAYTGGIGGEEGGNISFDYVLTSGASWHGPIGHATLICDLSDTPYSPLNVKPGGYRRVGTSIIWDLHNVKPTEGISLNWYPSYLNVKVNGKLVEVGGVNQFWNTNWTPVASRRRGDDVWLPAKAAAAWIGGRFKIVQMNKAVKILRGSQWVEATVGSNRLLVSTGGVQNMAYPCVQEPSTCVFIGKGAATMVSLRAVVTAFGGTMTYDRANDYMYVVLK